MLDLDAIEKRANAATPGPWVCRPTIVCDELMEAVISKGAGNITVVDACEGADGDFISGARDDVPALISSNRKLRAFAEAVVENFDCDCEELDDPAAICFWCQAKEAMVL